MYLLWALEVTVDDFVIVQIFDTRGNLFCPLDQARRWNLILAFSQKVVQRAVGTVLHDDAENWGLGAHAAELYDVGMVELA